MAASEDDDDRVPTKLLRREDTAAPCAIPLLIATSMPLAEKRKKNNSGSEFPVWQDST
ncbi:hypothetical protein DAPPUDRAFT_238226 [Daphnia pulex]|uniref:Uncharacterized protein n=1 Tax=Daphnia pulex TaxID=6669 RepID=E9G5U6_DAPPU|nr:hypothetical protein DAPPUDRAFT_238226 [Daphnia pulex]|eukprot:EFX85109.1 hypothetical protein DAPPUDRAFT_238226 [Daphnia pulex]